MPTQPTVPLPEHAGSDGVDRFGTTAEVAALVAYLAGPEAAYITGSSLDIDGGFGA